MCMLSCEPLLRGVVQLFRGHIGLVVNEPGDRSTLPLVCSLDLDVFHYTPEVI